jgi:hypothetical protein
MNPQDNGKAHVVIPYTFYCTLKEYYDEGHRIKPAQSDSTSLPAHLRKDIRNIPRMRPRRQQNAPSLESEDVVPSDEDDGDDMDGQGRGEEHGHSILQAQRDINLAANAGFAASADAGPGASITAADNCTDQNAALADLREVGSKITGSMADGKLHFAKIPKPAQVYSVNAPREKIDFVPARGKWYYMGGEL